MYNICKNAGLSPDDYDSLSIVISYLFYFRMHAKVIYKGETPAEEYY